MKTKQIVIAMISVTCLALPVHAETFVANTTYPGSAVISHDSLDILSVVQFGVDNLPPVDASLRYAITDVRVGIAFDHQWAADIEAALMFGGETVGLFYDAGRGANFASGPFEEYWIHMDGEALPTAGTIPIGTYRPDVGDNEMNADLGIFNGMDPKGHWMLHIADDFPADDGVFYGWSLELDLEIVPEPSGLGLILLGLMGMVRRCRAAS